MLPKSVRVCLGDEENSPRLVPCNRGSVVFKTVLALGRLLHALGDITQLWRPLEREVIQSPVIIRDRLLPSSFVGGIFSESESVSGCAFGDMSFSSLLSPDADSVFGSSTLTGQTGSN